jgi:hypothetical protein
MIWILLINSMLYVKSFDTIEGCLKASNTYKDKKINTQCIKGYKA